MEGTNMENIDIDLEIQSTISFLRKKTKQYISLSANTKYDEIDTKELSTIFINIIRESNIFLNESWSNEEEVVDNYEARLKKHEPKIIKAGETKDMFIEIDKKNVEIDKKNDEIEKNKFIHLVHCIHRISNYYKNDSDYEIELLRSDIEKNKRVFIELECYLKIFLCIPDSIPTALCSRNLNIVETIKKYEIDQRRNSGEVCFYYRGESNKDFNLIPSMFRGLGDGAGNISGIVTYEDICGIYEDYELKKKYTEIFGSSQIDYKFLAYMQHSIAFSPLIDFTENGLVAATFASFSENTNVYNLKDFSIYQLGLNSEDKKLIEMDNLKKYKVLYLPNGLKFDTMVFDNYGGSHTMNEMFEFWRSAFPNLKPKMFFSDKKTNDRMIYQSGVFLLFYNCIIVKNAILTPLMDKRIQKLVIPHDKRKEWYSEVRKISEKYEYSNLLDPYKYLSEYFTK